MQSVDYFSKTEMRTKPYTLNIAAVYNYLGEINGALAHHSRRCFYYNKAIALSVGNRDAALRPRFTPIWR